MYEVKSDPLEASFARPDEMAAMKAEMSELRRKVDAHAVQAGRPPLSGAKAAGDPAAKAFVDRYLRQGGEAGVELKALSTGSDPAGGYAVPAEIDQVIGSTLKGLSPIRAIANVVTVGSSGYRRLVATGGTPSGWAADDAARPDTATPTFAEVAPPFGDLYANPAASQAMLDDAAFDVEAWLADEIAREFARAEGSAFVGGDGASKPKGFLTYPVSTAPDGNRPFGTLEVVATGQAGGFPASDPQDRLIDLVQSLAAPYRQGACFVMNAGTLGAVRKFKTSEGAFLWQPGLVSGQPDTLLGYPVVEAADMPDMTDGSLSVAFGNFQAGYLIADRGETQILRDPFTNKPFVHFYATRRVGGAVQNSEAIKLLRFAAA